MTSTEKNTTITEIRCLGNNYPCDMIAYTERANIVLLSFYGSMNQVKAVFAALAMGSSLTVKFSDHRIKKNLYKGCKLKTIKMGHGKYHAIIYNPDYKKDIILIFDGEEEIDAWREFFKRTKIPMIDEWIPKLIPILKNEGHIIPLYGFRVRGYEWIVDDDTVCDIIVERIYTKEERRVNEY